MSLMALDLPSGLSSFIAVAQTGSFAQAAVRLGVSPSAVGQQVRTLESRLGTALFQRSTRSVRLTEAGQRYFDTVEPAISTILEASRLATEPGATPSGTVRLTLPRTAYHAILRPRLAGFMASHPKVVVELSIDSHLVDIVRDGFDGGIRFGDLVQQDMIAIRVGPDMRTALFASPAYLARRGRPATPRDLSAHDCIGFRAATSRVVERWSLTRNGQTIRVAPSGPLVVSGTEALLCAARDGLGIIEYIDGMADAWIARGQLERVLGGWHAGLAAFHLYYPSRRRMSPAMRALVDTLRISAGDAEPADA